MPSGLFLSPSGKRCRFLSIPRDGKTSGWTSGQGRVHNAPERWQQVSWSRLLVIHWNIGVPRGIVGHRKNSNYLRPLEGKMCSTCFFLHYVTLLSICTLYTFISFTKIQLKIVYVNVVTNVMVFLAKLILMITQTKYSPLYIHICHLREWEVLFCRPWPMFTLSCFSEILNHNSVVNCYSLTYLYVRPVIAMSV